MAPPHSTPLRHRHGGTRRTPSPAPPVVRQTPEGPRPPVAAEAHPKRGPQPDPVAGDGGQGTATPQGLGWMETDTLQGRGWDGDGGVEIGREEEGELIYVTV